MNLEIGQSIDNRRVRLDFMKGGRRAEYMPSYEIQKTKADEFVTRYNAQSQMLNKVSLVSVILSSIFGGMVASNAFTRKKVWVPAGIMTGTVVGLGVGAAIASGKRNELMDKYDVVQLKRR